MEFVQKIIMKFFKFSYKNGVRPPYLFLGTRYILSRFSLLLNRFLASRLFLI